MGLHQRYASLLEEMPDTLAAGHEEETDKMRAGISHAFEGMMKALYSQEGAQFNISILETPKVQEFIETHSSALDSSFRQVEMSDTMRQRLQRSDYIFSGIKTFHELNEAFPSLLDENGNRKPFERFLNDVRKIDQTYNANYLRAEYSFVHASAEMAAKWEEYMEDGDRYNLQYRTAADDHVREEHAAMHGITLPPSDPFWDVYYPPNGWGCRCLAVQVRRDKYPASDPDKAMKLGERATSRDKRGIFRFNAGKQQKTFPDYNPYTISRCRDCDIAKGKLKLARNVPPDNELCEACRLIRQCEFGMGRASVVRKSPEIKKLQGTTINNKEFNHTVVITGRTLREWTNQPHKHYIEKNKMLYNISEVFSNAKYLGATPYDKEGVRCSHIFETWIEGEKSWIIVREYDTGEFILHSISDGDKVLEGIQKKEL